MDSWTESQIKAMFLSGGNDCFRQFMLQRAGIDLRDSNSPVGFREKYENKTAELYRRIIQARVRDEPEPTELPPSPVRGITPTSARRMEGFGSCPAPSEGTSGESVPFSQTTKWIIIPVAAATVTIVAWCFIPGAS
jgi:hypothetical protein